MSEIKLPFQIPLTEDQKAKIMAVIDRKRQPEDRDPSVVVAADFNGDWEVYLQRMAKYHQVDIF